MTELPPTSENQSYESNSVSIGARLSELAWVFTKLGITGFGGPAAHIAMIETEVVTKRQWLTREALLDLLGISNLLPGPNSTELAIHIGLLRGGWRGLVVAGVCFILPAMLLVWGLAIGYAQYQALPQVEAVFYGVKPVIIGIIAQAVWKLGKSLFKRRLMIVATGLAVGLVYLQLHEVLVLIATGLLVIAWDSYRIYQLRTSSRNSAKNTAQKINKNIEPDALTVNSGNTNPESMNPENSRESIAENTSLEATSHDHVNSHSRHGEKYNQYNKYAPWLALPILPLGLVKPMANFASRPEVWVVFAIFLQIGFVLYGGGYVLFAFLQQQLVERNHWLTSQQLIDAIAIGQFTPGPLFTTATFVGYLLAGHGGAIGATIGIFLPAFICVGLVSPLVPYLRGSVITGKFLDGVNCGALALMIAVTFELGQQILVNGMLWVITVITWLVLYRYPKFNSILLVIGGAVFGVIYRTFS